MKVEFFEDEIFQKIFDEFKKLEIEGSSIYVE